MALQAPPGHPAQPAALIAAQFAGLTLNVKPPDADLQDATLELDGDTVRGTSAILKLVAAKSKEQIQLYPSGCAAEIDTWLDSAFAIETASKAWVEPYASSGAYDDEARSSTQGSISASLMSLETRLSGGAYLVSEKGCTVGGEVTLADIAVAAALQPLLASVLSSAARSAYPGVIQWFVSLSGTQSFAKILGSLSLCAAAEGWVAPVAKDGKKGKKKNNKGGAGESVTASQLQSAGQDEELDPEKAAKKAAKLAEKAAKEAKFAAKQAALNAAKQTEAEKAASGASDKKANAKAEAEAKKKAEAEEVAALLAGAQSTPSGSKKDTSPETMCKTYHPKIVETAWYQWWEQCGYFKPDPKSTKPPFVIVIPPPNVTGTLHLGHALTNSIQDTIVRWRRMSGYNTLWVPGTDHAGIATQTVVEKKLQRERGVTRHDLGRDNFLTEVWKWVDQYGGRICDQLRRIGSSVDWSRKAFTMDENLSRAVLEAFVRMHEQGCIYRDNRLVNWCCKLKTAVSDIEVDYIDIPRRTLLNVPGYAEPVEFGVLTSFAYPLEDGSAEIVVATTRPETMLGDTAVAVHPDDPRYAAMHGKFVIHPVDGRRFPIICDAELVDMSFGTGAVKVTPAHDPNDFATGKRHNLEFINIFDDNGLINDKGGLFKGQPRFKTRLEIVEFLKGKGLFRGTADNAMRLGLCSRSKDVIEPVLKPQWWVNCKDMAAKSAQAVRDGTLEMIPKEAEAVWFKWLDNIRDWCISRQLWWGHRIPAYYVNFEDEAGGSGGNPGMMSEDMTRWVIGRSEDEAMKRAQSAYPGRKVRLTQDEDVLDTWFSSGLFPFSVFQWPLETEDLKAFYPGALLETGHDILFFWVARMVMMGIQLTGEVPFKQVFLHAMVRDAHGRKMSKSLGNVIDPLDVIDGISLEGLHQTLMGGNLDVKEIEKAKQGQKADYPDGIEECGTDALRFALCAYTSQARDINLDIKRVVAYRHWCNKLWNAIKFAMMNLPEGFSPPSDADLDAALPGYPLASKWILSRLNGAVAATIKAMEAYDFSTATQRLYSFWQYDLCDVFIELMKPVMYLDDAEPGTAAAKLATRNTLWACLEAGLRLLHPFMPFVTEELWQRLPKVASQAIVSSIMVSEYPSPNDRRGAPQLERDFDYVQTLITTTRKLRSDYGLLVKQKPRLFLAASESSKRTVLSSLSGEISTLTTSSDVTVLGDGETAPSGCSVAIVDDSTTIYMLLVGILDPILEVQKLQKKVTEIEGRIEAMRRKTALPSYEKTPDNVKADDQDKLTKAEAELAASRSAILEFQRLGGA